MDVELTRPIPCAFCRNYLTTTTTAEEMCEGYSPSTTCQACVRLYEGSLDNLNPSKSSNDVSQIVKTPNNLHQSSLTSFYHLGTECLSCWSHLIRRRWLRRWRVWLDVLEPVSSMSAFTSSSPSSSSQQSVTLSTSRFPYLVVLVLLFCVTSAGACSSRSTPKPRPPSQGTMRPNITFQTYACPPAYAAWYCLNGATCFTVKIADSILYNCECADGYMGQRCEFKDLDGSYLPARERLMMGQNANIGHAFLVVLLIVMAAIVASVIFTLKRTRSKQTRRRGTTQQEIGFDVDLDFVYGTSSSVLPHYNNNNSSSSNAAIHHVTSLGHTTFCETAIGGATSGLSPAQKADTSVLGQSISYTLSRQNVPRQNVDYSPDSYYVNGNRSLSRHHSSYNHRVPQACYRTNEHFT